MGISPYLRGLRERVGHDLLVVAAVAVLPWDERGRLLLVREADSGRWQTIGGAVDPDESPQHAAAREAHEEAAIDIEIERIRGVAGGPQFRLRYTNGDLVGYVSIVFDAQVAGGEPRPDGEETTEVGWFSVGELGAVELTPFTVALFEAVGVGG